MSTGRMPLWWIGLPAIAGVLVLENLGAGPLNRLLLYLPGVDKVLHTLQSFVILLACHGMLGRTLAPRGRRLVAAAALTLMFGLFDEAQQGWAGRRNVDPNDVAAGLGGLALGAALLTASTHPRRSAVVAAGAVVLSGLVTLDSYHATKDYSRGMLLEREGLFREARPHFQRALAAGTDTADFLNELAWVEIESGEGDPAAAVRYAERSLARRPGSADTLDTYGWALHHAGRSAEGLVALRQAYAIKPAIFCIHYHLAVVLLALGQQDEAFRHLAWQIERFPRTREAGEAAGLLARLGIPAAGAP